MARTPVNLYSNSSLAAVKTTVIPAEVGTKRIIRKASFSNTTAGTLTLDIYIDPTGSDEVHIRVTKSLAAYETWSCPELEGEVLEALGTLSLTPSAIGIGASIPGVKVT